MENNPADKNSYAKKVWLKGGVYALIVVIILLFKATFSVFLLILAGALIAIFFTGLSDLICRKTGWKEGVGLAVSVIGVVLLVFGLFWLIGAKAQSQAAELSDKLPAMIENAKTRLSQSNWTKGC
jgi:predicted PurR-regulated permease PerM